MSNDGRSVYNIDMAEYPKTDSPIESGFDPRAQPILHQILMGQVTVEQAGHPFCSTPKAKLGIIITRDQMEAITGRELPPSEPTVK
jgi:hypothetical protein